MDCGGIGGEAETAVGAGRGRVGSRLEPDDRSGHGPVGVHDAARQFGGRRRGWIRTHDWRGGGMIAARQDQPDNGAGAREPGEPTGASHVSRLDGWLFRQAGSFCN